MNKTSYHELLRKLSNAYYQNHIGIEEYRIQRKKLLDKIESWVNAEQPKPARTENQD